MYHSRKVQRGVAARNAVVLAVVLGSVTGILAASTTEDCATLVPIEDRRRGKGAFFSGCTSRSMTTSRGGCWSTLIEEQSGCQTCIVQATSSSTTATDDPPAAQWNSSVFSKFFEMELDPCPESVSDLYGTPPGGVVSYQGVLSADCHDNDHDNDDNDNNDNNDSVWLAFENSCYAKSSYLDAAVNWDDADARCKEVDARLVSLESEAENDFVTYNLLWIGFLGEAYTGLRKTSEDGTWSWRDSLAGFTPGDFDASASFQDWGEGLDASSSYESTGASCLEITPYYPKAWNPFSCEVNKQYVCERPASLGPSSSSSQQSTTTAPELPPSPVDDGVARGSQGTPAPTASAIASFVGSPSSAEFSSNFRTESPTGSPTGSPTSAPTAMYSLVDGAMVARDDASCAERLGEHEQLSLATYDMSVFNDAAGCEETLLTEEPHWCNSFEIGQECRSCWLSCDGARLYLADFSWSLEDKIIFCPGVGLSDFGDDCGNAGNNDHNNENSGPRHRTLRETFQKFDSLSHETAPATRSLLWSQFRGFLRRP
ncbi:unnamed protein product [Ectocarpus sp. 12 AP-2014]